MRQLLVMFRWPSGREEVRYERTYPSLEAEELILQVQRLQQAAIMGGWDCPYFYTFR